MTGTSIKLCDVSFAYKEKNVLEHISEFFEPGSKTAIMAPSGSGKTTLLFLIAGLLTPGTGTVEFSKTTPKVSMVFQEDRLLEQQSVLCNLHLIRPDISHEELVQMLKHAGLPDVLNQKVSKLSGGEKRRIAIIRALLAEYDILLLDEPFTGLDEQTKATMMQLIADKTTDKTVILVTHNHNETTICDTVKHIVAPS